LHRLDAKTWSIRRNRGQQWLSISSQAQAKSGRNWRQSELFLAWPAERPRIVARAIGPRQFRSAASPTELPVS